jgi:hypothetical protein
MIELASGLIVIPFLLGAVGDLEASDGKPAASDYSLCVPWALPANPQSWDEVLDYYTDPPFARPTGFDILPPLPGAERVHPINEVAGATDSLKGDWDVGGTGPRKVQQKSEGVLGSWESQMLIQSAHPAVAWEDPLRKRQWQTDEAWKCPVLGPLSVYGQVNAATEEMQQQDMKVTGKTGVACSVPTGIPQAALTLRSGPSVTYTDPLRPERMRERAEWAFEVQGRVPLLAGIGLEYQGIALPALTPLDHDRLTQDLRLAVPMGPTGKFTVGAKRQWELATDPRAGTDSTQLYLGLELKR